MTYDYNDEWAREIKAALIKTGRLFVQKTK